MYTIELVCDGCPKEVGEQAAKCITEEFRQRPWHQNVICRWDGENLRLEATNDFDSEGKALTDEFSDSISGCVAEGFEGDIRVGRITSEPD